MTRGGIGTVAIVALCGVIVVGAQTPPAGAEGTASIAGAVVRDLTAETVENAQVTLIDGTGAGPNRTTSTSQAGLFKFSGLRAGRYELRAIKPAFVVGSYGADKPERLGRPIVLAADAHITDVHVPVFTGAVVSGTVWSPDNQPAPRGTIVATRTTWLAGGQRVESESRAVTDDRGRFRIFGLPPDDYVIATTRLHLNAGEQRPDIDIRLPALTRSIHVQVRAADGSDVSGLPVSVRVFPVGDVITPTGPTPKAGTNIVVENLAPGPYRISASAPQSRLGVTLVEVSASGPVQDVTVLLRPLSSVTGSVTARSVASSRRENFGTGRVWLTEIGDAVAPKRYEVSVGSNSQFAIRGVPAGRYQIDARGIVAGGGLSLWTLRTVSRDGQPIDRVIDVGGDTGGEIAGGVISGLELTLVDDLATLSGSILTGDGHAAPPYFIVLIATTPDASGVPQAYYARPAADGSYQLAGILEGEYALAVVQDVRPDDLNNPGVLSQFKAAATMTLTFVPNEDKRQDLRVGLSFALPLTFDLLTSLCPLPSALCPSTRYPW